MRGGYQGGELPVNPGPQPKPAAFMSTVSNADYYGRHAQPPLAGWHAGLVFYRHFLQRFERVDLVHVNPYADSWFSSHPLEES
jgi:hypothetical protein